MQEGRISHNHTLYRSASVPPFSDEEPLDIIRRKAEELDRLPCKKVFSAFTGNPSSGPAHWRPPACGPPARSGTPDTRRRGKKAWGGAGVKQTLSLPLSSAVLAEYGGAEGLRQELRDLGCQGAEGIWNLEPDYLTHELAAGSRSERRTAVLRQMAALNL